MLQLCLSTSAFAAPSSAYQEEPDEPASAPIPIGAHREENGMMSGRSAAASSSLSSSAESLCSVRSSCSTRSAAEREAERRERKRLLDLSIAKISGAAVPLRRHLLVYNAAKTLQRELECLDEEELYLSLYEPMMEVETWAEKTEPMAPLTIDTASEVEEKEDVEDEEMVSPTARAAAWVWQSDVVGGDINHDDLSGHQESVSVFGHSSWYRGGGCGGTAGCGGSAWALPPTPSVTCPSSSFWSSLRDDSPMAGASSSFAYEWASWEESGAAILDCAPISTHDLLHLLPMQA